MIKRRKLPESVKVNGVVYTLNGTGEKEITLQVHDKHTQQVTEYTFKN